MNLEPSIKSLIFDLGGVIIDLSVDHTLQAFSDLSRTKKEKIEELFVSAPGFEEYEKGLISDDDFRNFVRKVYGIQCSSDEIDACWNAMLLGLPVIKLALLKNLKQHYNVFLLSNTNGIHLDYINQVMLPALGQEEPSLDSYFHRSYYSHRMKKRKPNADIFEQVLEENSLIPHQTLFLDDNKCNIEGAHQLGIKTLHVTSPDLILDYFHEK